MRVGGHLWKKKDDAEGREYLVGGRRSFGWVVNIALYCIILLTLRLYLPYLTLHYITLHYIILHPYIIL